MFADSLMLTPTPRSSEPIATTEATVVLCYSKEDFPLPKRVRGAMLAEQTAANLTSVG